MRSIAGLPLSIGHVGDVRYARALFAAGIRAVIALIWVAKAGAMDVAPGLWAEVKATLQIRETGLA